MKVLIVLSVLAVFAAGVPQDSTEQVRVKRGVLGVPAAVSYSSQLVHHTPSIPVIHTPIVKYVAPAVKIIQPYPIAKFVAPAYSYTKVAYPSPILPYYGYGYGFSHYH